MFEVKRKRKHNIQKVVKNSKLINESKVNFMRK